MTYLMSDIHGHYDEFIQMLVKINFSKDDELYLLGDVIDRGPLPITLLLYILQQPNIILLMGNHEKMMIDALSDTGEWGDHARYLWENNGAESTKKEFSLLGKKQQKELLKKLNCLQYYCIVEKNGFKYLLSHSGVAMRDTLESAIESDVATGRILWNREDILFWKNKSDTIMIHGHTPSWRWHPELKSVIYRYENGKKINIDCGCAQNRVLGCLCLDTMEEFYVPCKNLFDW